MRNIWLVIKHDAGVTLRQRSFWIISFLLPVVLVGLQGFLVLQENSIRSGGATEAEGSGPAGTATLPAIGLVDPAGLAATIPPGIPAGLFVRYPDEAAARSALDKGEVEQVVSIPVDYVASGQVTVYDRDFELRIEGESTGVGYGSSNEWMLGYLLNYNLMGDPKLLTALQNPTPGDLAQMHALNPPKPTGPGSRQLAELLSRLVPYVFYFLLLMGSTYLMRSVVTEKENRTAEVVLLSVNPKELMLGKILAMSLVLVIQMAIWVGGGALALDKGAQLLSLTRISFPPGFLLWAALFVVLGYLLFASIMAAAGAISSNYREAAQVTWLLVIPLMPTLMFGPLLIEQPNSPLVMFLSLFPFSSPAAMVTRLAVQTVPLWQLLLSLALLAATTYAAVVLAARFFRSGNLLAQESFNWGRFARGWRGEGAELQNT